MQGIIGLMKEKAAKLLTEGTVNRVLGWEEGEFTYDQSPAVFTSVEDLDRMVYGCFSAPNLSKYLINETKKDGKILAFLKPCDTLSFNQLIVEHRIDRNKVYIVGIECHGKADIEKIKKYAKGVISAEENQKTILVHTLYGDVELDKKDVLLEKCMACKGKKHRIYDELIVVNEMEEQNYDRFSNVAELEKMTPDERYAFFKKELSKCIRCNACRNICPACSCVKCVFDNDDSGVKSKANSDSFEEKLFHIIRAFHVAGRCTDCGECSRVCPQGIPLHLLNRKFISDINNFYGEYQAGEDPAKKCPLTDFTKDDIEPEDAKRRNR